jgi:hypothetical protein
MTVIFEKFQRALIPQLCDGDHALSGIGQPHNHMAISMVPAADPLI